MPRRVCSVCGLEFLHDRPRKTCSPECNEQRRVKSSTKHGDCGSRLYKIWMNAKNRCEGRAGKAQNALYADRGINMCHEWASSFAVFRDWAVANGYTEELTLDRRDSDLGYCPDNCRWATRTQQATNRRKRTDSPVVSRFKGVSRVKRSSKWSAKATVDGVTTYLGVFDTEEGAGRAYDEFARKHFGEYARTNFDALEQVRDVRAVDGVQVDAGGGDAGMAESVTDSDK